MTGAAVTSAGPVRGIYRHGVTLGEASRVWLRVAALSFGGPAGQIAVMHRIIVDEKKWVGENRFLHALSYCMLLPGPEAHQLAIYIGWLMHRLDHGAQRRLRCLWRCAGDRRAIPGA
jgi:chromate transporter